jgi:hypothetical protein
MAGKWLDAFREFIGHLRIDSKELEGPQPLLDNIYESQKMFLEQIAEGLERDIHHFVCLKARQLGVSTISLAVTLFWITVHEGIQGALITKDEGDRDKFRIILDRYIQSLPKGLRVGTNKFNRSNLVLENGSVLDFVVAGTKKASGGGLGRSRAWNLVHGTECSSWGSVEGVASMKASMAQKHPNRLFMFESTARGFNLFHDMWAEAEDDDLTQSAFFIGWWAKEDYCFLEGSEKFNHFWTGTLDDGEKILVDQVSEKYGYEMTSGQIAWHRWARTHLISDAALMDQEYPWCVGAETRVGTDRGIVPISEIAPGVLTANGLVVASGPTGEAQLFRVRTELGYEFRGTANHPLISIAGKELPLSESMGKAVQLCIPRAADEVFVCQWRAGPVVHSVTIDEDMARLVGLFMGDGSMQRNAFSMACDAKDMDVVEECVRLIRDIFGQAAQVRSTSKGGKEVRITSELVYRTFRSLGLLRTDTGKTQRRVHVPEFIWRSPAHIIREFLRGLFEADGFNGYKSPRVVLFSKYPEFLRDVQLLLLAFGITCKRHSATRKNPTHTYQANEVILRKEEAIAFNERIGFMSARKRMRYLERPEKRTSGAQSVPMRLVDTVKSIEPCGKEQVFNLTVEGCPLFDAGGILTHNTADQAFIMTGRAFFPTRRLSDDIAWIKKERLPFRGFRYHMGDNFLATQVEQVGSPAEADLRIWEEPHPNGVYVIGADPAFGRSDENDQHALQVLRCYADRAVQVAEYGTAVPETYQFAWVLSHIAGSYRNVWVNLEINGPGAAVMRELQHLKQLINNGYLKVDAEHRGLAEVFDAVKWYLYHRIDAIGGSYMYNWKTSADNKLQIMSELRDNYALRALRLRSIRLLEQMQRIVQDGAAIEASGHGKDDLNFALALANKAWIEWVRPSMIGNGLTYDVVTEKERMEREAPQATMMTTIVADFFKDRERAREEDNYQKAWKGGAWS